MNIKDLVDSTALQAAVEAQMESEDCAFSFKEMNDEDKSLSLTHMENSIITYLEKSGFKVFRNEDEEKPIVFLSGPSVLVEFEN